MTESEQERQDRLHRELAERNPTVRRAQELREESARLMADAQETQHTSKGLEIPVPKRRDVMSALKKLVQPAKKP